MKKLSFEFVRKESVTGYPKGCYVMTSTAYFNTHSMGRATSSARPLCNSFSKPQDNSPTDIVINNCKFVEPKMCNMILSQLILLHKRSLTIQRLSLFF